jgi:ATP-dependent Clp endopeptidase proteolytic subunit ClpP
MAEILIYDDIGPEWAGMVSAKGILDAIAAVPSDEPLVIRVNSPGGSVNEALAIYNAIERRGDVTIAIDGLAASSASFIAMAGKQIVIAANAMMMIHNPWTFAIGDGDELRKTASVLDKYAGQLASAYANRAKKPVSEIAAAMDAETWYTAQEALTFGLVDGIGAASDAVAAVAPTRFKRTPQSLLSDQPAKEMQNRREIYHRQLSLTLKRRAV